MAQSGLRNMLKENNFVAATLGCATFPRNLQEMLFKSTLPW